MADSSPLDLFEKSSLPVVRPLAQVWAWAVLLVLPVALYFVYRDLGLYTQLRPFERAAFQPDALAWAVFCGIQIAGKLPLAFDYPLRGAAAVFDLAVFAAGLAAAACVAAGVAPGPAPLWWALLALGLVWLAGQLWLAAFPPQAAGTPRPSVGRRLYCAFAAGLIPNLPFPFALYLVAHAA